MSKDNAEDLKEQKNESKGKLFPDKINVGLMGLIITLVIALVNTSNENNKRIQSLHDEISELKETNESVNRKLNEQMIYIDNLKNNLLFIYTRADLSSIDQWRNSLIEHKSKAETDLAMNKMR
ncbi:MAG: hypothetical protein P4L42_14575 [Desulfocapsaceae bacterium]|nr:hypothetical protein [Desulfocapsaceae bacterium]